MAKKTKPSSDEPKSDEVVASDPKKIRKQAKKKDPGSGTQGPPSLSEYDRYELIELDRLEIKNAPYNPRVMSEKAARRLLESIKRNGLVAPITWNRRTGHIVGGHQRIKALDTIHKSKYYTLRVAAIDVELKQEQELNVFLNNPNAQGEYDIEKLAELIKIDKIDYEAAGFSPGDIYQMYGEDILAEKPAELMNMMEKMREARATFEETMAAKQADLSVDDRDFFCVVVFANNYQREVFAAFCGSEDGRYLDGMDLWEFMVATGKTPDEFGAHADETPPTPEQLAAIHNYNNPPTTDDRGVPLSPDSQNKILESALDLIDRHPSLLNYYSRRVVEGHECPRCGMEHRLVVLPLARPLPGATHWGKCPNTSEPVFIERDVTTAPPLLCDIQKIKVPPLCRSVTPDPNATSS